MRLSLFLLASSLLGQQSPWTLNIPVRGGQSGEARFFIPNGNYVTLRGPLTGSTFKWRLPINDTTGCWGSAGDGSGQITILPCSASGGISSLNGLTGTSQTFAAGSAGTDFAISSSSTTHTFNLPTVSGAARGLVTSSLFNTWNAKESVLTFSSPLSRVGNVVSCPTCTSGGGGGAPTDATYITQTTNATLTNEQALSALATGILKNTTITGVLTIAIAGDFPTLNQNTTGSAASLSTTFTQHQVLIGNSSGVPTTVGSLGTASQVLTSNGPGLAPSWQNATGGSGGAVEQTFATSATTVTITDSLGTVTKIADCYLGTAPNYVLFLPSTIQFNTNSTVITFSATPSGGKCVVSSGGGGGGGGGGITSLSGDVLASGSGGVAATVVGINGILMGSLGTGILKNTTTTGVPSIAVAGDFPTLNQNTTGTSALAAALTTNFNQYAILYGNGNGVPFQTGILGTAGQVLTSNGAGSFPNFQTPTTGGITTLNGLTALTQTFATGSSGTDFNISSATSTHTFNLPTVSGTNRGLVTTALFNTWQNKIDGPGTVISGYIPAFNGTSGTSVTTGLQATASNVVGSLVLRASLTEFGLIGASSVSTNLFGAGLGASGNVVTGYVLRSTDTAPTANIFEWRTQAGAVLSAINNNGDFKGPVMDTGITGGQVFNIKAYGAIGDGTTIDNTAIAAAITAACVAGGRVYVPPGVYAINAALTIGNGNGVTSSTCNSVTLEGAGTGWAATHGASRLKWTGSAPSVMTWIVNFSGPISGGGVKNITLDANSVANVGGISYRTAYSTYNENVMISKVNSNYALELTNIGISTESTCYNIFSHIQSIEATTAASGILLDGAVGNGSGSGAVCSNRFLGGTFQYDSATLSRVQYTHVTTSGSGCTGTPVIGFSGGGGSGAAATGYLVSGKMHGIRMTNMGTGYTSDPAVAITGLSGCGVSPVATAYRQPKGMRAHFADNNSFYGLNVTDYAATTNSSMDFLGTSFYGASVYPSANVFYGGAPSRRFASIGSPGVNTLDNVSLDDCGGLNSTCEPGANFKGTVDGVIFSTPSTPAQAKQISTGATDIIFEVANINGGINSGGCYGFRRTSTLQGLMCNDAVSGQEFHADSGAGMTKVVSLYPDGYGIGIRVGRTLVNLGTPANGTLSWCTDCAPTSSSDPTCVGSSTGTLAFRVNGGWKCL